MEKKELKKEVQPEQKQIEIVAGNVEVLKVKVLGEIAQQLSRIANALENKGK
jgi:hypothetical protein